MTGHERRAFDLIRELVAAHGMTAQWQIGGKHRAVVATHPDGRWHKFPVSGSPRSASCQLRQIRQQVTAWLERAGFETGRGEPGERRRQHRQRRVRSTTHRIEVALDPETGPARDPWQALAALKEPA